MSAARRVLLFLGCWLACVGLNAAERKNKEEAEQSKDPAQLLAESKERTSVSGIFRFNAETLRDGKPLPKHIGTITGQGPQYQVIVRDTTVLSRLVRENGKKVIVSGSFVNAGEQGIFILADSLIESEGAPAERRKRGGL